MRSSMIFFPRHKVYNDAMWDEVWGEPDSGPPLAAPPVSAREATEAATTPGPPPDAIQLLHEEVAEMRREQAQRNTLHLVVTCVLFALLMHHLDRPRVPRA